MTDSRNKPRNSSLLPSALCRCLPSRRDRSGAAGSDCQQSGAVSARWSLCGDRAQARSSVLRVTRSASHGNGRPSRALADGPLKAHTCAPSSWEPSSHRQYPYGVYSSYDGRSSGDPSSNTCTLHSASRLVSASGMIPPRFTGFQLSLSLLSPFPRTGIELPALHLGDFPIILTRRPHLGCKVRHAGTVGSLASLLSLAYLPSACRQSYRSFPVVRQVRNAINMLTAAFSSRLTPRGWPFGDAGFPGGGAWQFLQQQARPRP